jgi:hypothetical protein
MIEIPDSQDTLLTSLLRQGQGDTNRHFSDELVPYKNDEQKMRSPLLSPKHFGPRRFQDFDSLTQKGDRHVPIRVGQSSVASFFVAESFLLIRVELELAWLSRYLAYSDRDQDGVSVRVAWQIGRADCSQHG